MSILPHQSFQFRGYKQTKKDNGAVSISELETVEV